MGLGIARKRRKIEAQDVDAALEDEDDRGRMGKGPVQLGRKFGTPGKARFDGSALKEKKK